MPHGSTQGARVKSLKRFGKAQENEPRQNGSGPNGLREGEEDEEEEEKEEEEDDDDDDDENDEARTS